MQVFRSFLRFRKAFIRSLCKQAPDICSFDVFDTLIFRRCHPDVVLEGVGRWLDSEVKRLGINAKQSGLAAYHQAYAQLAQANVANQLDGEVFTQDLYQAWASQVSSEKTEELAQGAREKMHEFELSVCYPNEKFREVLASLRDQGVKLIYISDMFIGNELVSKILEQANLLPFFSDGFVSSDQALLKRTSRLFTHVKEKLKLQETRWWHVGDNVISDGEQPSAMGITSFVIQDQQAIARQAELSLDWEHLKKDSVMAGPLIANFAKAYEGQQGTLLQGYGQRILGPIYTSFIDEILQRAKQDRIDIIYFLAREGFLLHQLYSIVSKGDEFAPRAEYLCISRLVALLSGISSFGLREIALSLSNLPPSVENLLAPLKFSCEEIAKIAHSYGLPDPKSILPDFFMKWPPFMRLTEDRQIQARIDELRVTNSGLLFSYLEQMGFFSSERVAVVDVGWAGQIQDSLFESVKNHPKRPLMIGYYMGMNLTGHWRKQPENWMEWVYADSEHQDWSAQVAFTFPQSFEAVPRAPHGTTIGLKREGQKLIPEFKPDSNPSRELEAAHDPVMGLFQKGILEFAGHYCAASKMLGIESKDTVPYARDLIERMIRFPNKAEASWFLGMNNVADLGSDVGHLMGSPNERGKLFNRSARKTALGSSFWKYGTLAFHGGFFVQAKWAIKNDVLSIPFAEQAVAPGTVFHKSAMREEANLCDYSKPKKSELERTSQSQDFIDELSRKMEGLINEIERSSAFVPLHKYTGPLSAAELLKAYVVYWFAAKRAKRDGRKYLYRGGIRFSRYASRWLAKYPQLMGIAKRIFQLIK